MKPKSVSVYGVFLAKNGQVVLVKDASSLLWGFPGGMVEEGETHAVALQREMIEETGLSIRGNTRLLIVQTDESRDRFFYHIDQIEGVLSDKANGTDIIQARYFDITSLPLNLAPGIADVLKNSRAKA